MNDLPCENGTLDCVFLGRHSKCGIVGELPATTHEAVPDIWTRDVELLRRIVSSDRESVGDGQITGHTSGDVPDMVEHPPHYKQGGIETIDVIEAWQLGFCLGNAIKYISRAGKKDPGAELEDLKKARFYLNREIANIEKARAGGTDD
jgi:hypothetical protein